MDRGGRQIDDFPRPASQVRRALQQMLFPGAEFSWLRHVLIAIGLLPCINLLVIFAPNILGIFGVIGKGLASCEWRQGAAPGSFLSVNPGRCLSSYPTFRRWLPACAQLGLPSEICS